MGMQFLLRENQLDNPFLRAICKLLEAPGDQLYLTSGYASKHILIDTKTKQQQIFKDNQSKKYSFINSLNKGFKNIKNPNITIIGGMYKMYDSQKKGLIADTYQQGNFNGFLKTLESTVKVPIEFFRASSDLWHSKIALKVKSGEPVAAIVGSSNLSTRAFATWKTFNHEADIYMYKGNNGIRNSSFDVSLLKQERENLIEQFTDTLTQHEIPYDEKQLREELYSSDINDTKSISERISIRQKLSTEFNNLQYLLFTIKQYNLAINAAKTNKVSAQSVITVRPNIPVDQLLNDVFNILQNAMASYTTRQHKNINGDYLY